MGSWGTSTRRWPLRQQVPAPGAVPGSFGLFINKNATGKQQGHWDQGLRGPGAPWTCHWQGQPALLACSLALQHPMCYGFRFMLIWDIRTWWVATLGVVWPRSPCTTRQETLPAVGEHAVSPASGCQAWWSPRGQQVLRAPASARRRLSHAFFPLPCMVGRPSRTAELGRRDLPGCLHLSHLAVWTLGGGDRR